MKKLLIIPAILLCLAGASPRRIIYSTEKVKVLEQPTFSAKVDSLDHSFQELNNALK